MATKRHAKDYTGTKDAEEILALTNERASEKSLIMDYFVDFGKGSRFNPYDTITIPKGLFGRDKKNKNSFKTTIGLWVFNKSFIEPFSHVLGYINEPVTKDKYEEINGQLSYALLEEKITLEELKHFIMQSQILMSCTSAICPSHTMDLLLIADKAQSKKKQLEKENAEGIKNQDLVAMKNVEDGLISWAKDELKDSESVDMFNSGARSSWGNNFKNMYLTKGIIKQTDSTYNYATNSYMVGMDKKDLSNINDAAVGGPYSRARKTETGGYLEKQFTNATQHIKIKFGYDCGTKHALTVNLNKKNISDWMYCFVVGSNGSLTEITSDNKDKFIGKTVKIRFSGMCNAKNGYICEKCAGTLYKRIGVENVGLGCMIMMSSLKNKAMKAFHDSSTTLAKINPDEVFS